MPKEQFSMGVNTKLGVQLPRRQEVFFFWQSSTPRAGEAKESKTNIEVDGKVRWSGGRATWRSGSGNQNEGHNSIINYSDNGKAGNNENQGSGGSGDSGGNRNLGCMSNVHGEKL